MASKTNKRFNELYRFEISHEKRSVFKKIDSFKDELINLYAYPFTSRIMTRKSNSDFDKWLSKILDGMLENL